MTDGQKRKVWFEWSAEAFLSLPATALGTASPQSNADNSSRRNSSPRTQRAVRLSGESASPMMDAFARGMSPQPSNEQVAVETHDQVTRIKIAMSRLHNPGYVSCGICRGEFESDTAAAVVARLTWVSSCCHLCCMHWNARPPTLMSQVLLATQRRITGLLSSFVLHSYPRKMATAAGPDFSTPNRFGDEVVCAAPCAWAVSNQLADTLVFAGPSTTMLPSGQT